MGTHYTTGPTAQIRPTSVGGLLVVLASAVASVLSYGVLAETMRLHWTVGTHYHYGPEHAPTVAVLAAFPAALLGLYVGFRWLGRTLKGADEFEDLRALFELAALAVFGAVLAVQLLLVALNLWL